MNRKLRKSILAVLGTAALAGVSTQASAFGTSNLGTLSSVGQTVSLNSIVPQYAWDGTNGLGGPPNNNGWQHTSKWYTFTVGAGANQGVKITMTDTGNSASFSPAFTLYSITDGFDGNNHSNHIYNQTGTGGASADLTTDPDPGGLNNDHVTGWLGYANSGNTGWHNAGNAGPGGSNGDLIGTGSAGSSVVRALVGPWAGNPNPAGDNVTIWDGTSATLLLNLTAGRYLLATGGSCYTDGSTAACGTGTNFNFNVSATAVPIPAAAWLFGSALAGMGVFGRRKGKTEA